MKVLITGATGFLGRNIATRLLLKGHNVYGMGRNKNKGAYLSEKGGVFISCSLDQKKILSEICQEVDYVVHSAALSSPWGKREDFYKANVEGTQNIIEACLENNIKRLVYVSTPSLYFKFKNSLDILETANIEAPHPSLYTESKYYAEKAIEKAEKENGLKAIILRPRGIFGPNDESILPRIVSLAEKGKLKIIGKGENYVDVTYVDNVSQSIELALTCAEDFVGEKYNITNGEPIKQWDFINDLLVQLGFDPINKKVPISLAYHYAWALEKIFEIAGLKTEPPLTRYKVGLLCYDQTLSIEKARTELGYEPEVKMKDALRNVVEAWKK